MPPTVGGSTRGRVTRARSTSAGQPSARASTTARGTPSSRHTPVATTDVDSDSHSASSAAGVVMSAGSVDQSARSTSATIGITRSPAASAAGGHRRRGTPPPLDLTAR